MRLRIVSKQNYNEDAERRSYISRWCDAFAYRTEEEAAVAFAFHASNMREKAQLMRPERRSEVLAEVQHALPIDDPRVQQELKDGMVAFNQRVLDRIWRDHEQEFVIKRCAQCNRILKSPHAKQCVWCGNNWRDAEIS